MELISKSKEALFGVVAFAVLVWGWVRRRRERIAAAADQVQKQKLDDFIGRTLTVELEQMEVTDPEQLRPFLRRVTQIKQEALRELTSEKVRGDQLFAIFLSQCAALSEKIQMRMMYGRMSEGSGPRVERVSSLLVIGDSSSFAAIVAPIRSRTFDHVRLSQEKRRCLISSWNARSRSSA